MKKLIIFLTIFVSIFVNKVNAAGGAGAAAAAAFIMTNSAVMMNNARQQQQQAAMINNTVSSNTSNIISGWIDITSSRGFNGLDDDNIKVYYNLYNATMVYILYDTRTVHWERIKYYKVIHQVYNKCITIATFDTEDKAIEWVNTNILGIVTEPKNDKGENKHE